jgi:hypothetical protein
MGDRSRIRIHSKRTRIINANRRVITSSLSLMEMRLNSEGRCTRGRRSWSII